MTGNFKILVAGIAVLTFAGSTAIACTKPPVQPLSLKMRNLEPIDHNIPAPIVMEIDGFTTAGASSGDGCSAAPELPQGLFPISVSIVHADTDKPVGFGTFDVNARATYGFCRQGAAHCMAFTSRVSEKGIKPDVPIRIVIEALPKAAMDARELTNLGVQLARTAMITTGGVTDAGLPYHHLGVSAFNTVEIEFRDSPK